MMHFKQNRSRFTAALLCFAMVLSMCSLLSFGASAAEGDAVPAGVKVWDGETVTPFTVGTGTEGDPYEIATPEQFAYLRQQVNQADTAAAAAYLSAHYELTADLYFNDTSNHEGWITVTESGGLKTAQPKNAWTSSGIGTSAAPFTGTFDGKGHTIYGMYSKNYDHNDKAHAIFDFVSGTIKNVNVSKSASYNGLTSAGNVSCAGLVAQLIAPGSVDNCHISETFIGAGSVNVCGGVVGVTTGKGSTVSNCSFDGTLYSAGTGGNIKGCSAGGIVGSADASSSATIRNCVTYGSYQAAKRAGGITSVAGYTGASMTIINCVNYASVLARDAGSSAGGMINENVNGGTMSIYNCANFGTVTAGLYAGGAIGRSPKTTSYGDKVYGFYNAAKIKAVDTDGRAGGIIASFEKGNGTRALSVYYSVSVGTLDATNVGGIAAHLSIDAGYEDNQLNGDTNYSQIAAFPEAIATAYGSYITGSVLSDKEAAKTALNTAIATYNETATDKLSLWTMADTKIAAVSVSISDGFAFNFYTNGKDLFPSNFAPAAYVDGVKLEGKPAEVEGEAYTRYTVSDICASDMGKEVTMSLVCGTDTKAEKSYSILAYAVEQYESASAELKALLEAMMVYGNAAGDGTLLASFIAQTGCTVDDTFLDANYSAGLLTAPAASGMADAGITHVALSLGYNASPILLVDEDVASAEVTVGGATESFIAKDGYVTVKLSALQLNDTMTVVTYDAESNPIGTATYAVANYMADGIAGALSADADIALAKAAVIFMSCAIDYVDN